MQLRKLAGAASEKEACAILEQSITNGWEGLFPLKSNNNGNGYGTKARVNETVPTFSGDYSSKL
jgi:hypothetical protein